MLQNNYDTVAAELSKTKDHLRQMTSKLDEANASTQEAILDHCDARKEWLKDTEHLLEQIKGLEHEQRHFDAAKQELAERARQAEAMTKEVSQRESDCLHQLKTDRAQHQKVKAQLEATCETLTNALDLMQAEAEQFRTNLSERDTTISRLMTEKLRDSSKEEDPLASQLT